ncbi:hypothetical protein Misp06_00354 [Microbulbifer sp. NBRC 101763]
MYEDLALRATMTEFPQSLRTKIDINSGLTERA